MKKGFIVAAIIWLSLLAVVATVGYLIYSLGPRSRPISEGLSDLLPLFIIYFGFLGFMWLAIELNVDRPETAKTIIQIWFTILFLVSLTAVVSLLGLLIAPAAYFLFQAMTGKGEPKAAC